MRRLVPADRRRADRRRDGLHGDPGRRGRRRSDLARGSVDTFASPIPASKEPVAAVDPAGAAGRGERHQRGHLGRSDRAVKGSAPASSFAPTAWSSPTATWSRERRKITVFSSDEEPVRYDARLIGADCEHDLAVLKIDGTELPTVPLGDSATCASVSAWSPSATRWALEEDPASPPASCPRWIARSRSRIQGCAACDGRHGRRSHSGPTRT